MGACFTRDPYTEGVEGAPSDEMFCFKTENQLGLNKVEFTTFQGAVKRFGYRIDMTAEHMKSIAPELNLDFDIMMKDNDNIYAQVYRDKQVIFKNERYQVDAMVILGWLMCRHYDEDAQAQELWHMINPTL